MTTNKFVAIVTLAGAALLAYMLRSLPTENLVTIIALAALCALAQRMSITLFSRSSVSVAVAFAFTGMLLFGPAAAILVNLPSILVHGLWPRRRPVHKIGFNLGLVSLSAGVAGLVYLGIGGQMPPTSYVAGIVPMAVAVLCYFLIQSGAVTTAIVLSEGGDFGTTWESNYRWLLPNYLAIGGISLGMAIAYQNLTPVDMVSFGLPLVMVWYALRLYVSRSKGVIEHNAILQATNKRLEESFLSTIRALAATVDTKDHYTHDHSNEAMRYAAETAMRMGLSPTEVASVEVAALFHDIGKIGIPDDILHKAGPLDDYEWSIMRQHPQLGAKVVEQVTGLQGVVPAVLYHHERFDGTGYPEKLDGLKIPLTAQIVAVVDAYQSMTSTRPYRQARSHDYAVSELRRHSGSQFNPSVVDAFIAAREAVLYEQANVRPVDWAVLLRVEPTAPAMA